MAITKEQFRKVALSLPGAHEKLSYGTPAIFVSNKLLAQFGTREPDTIMLRTETFEERDHLIEADPATFFITDHFKSYKGLLARTSRLDMKTLKRLLQRRWLAIYPKSLLADQYHVRGKPGGSAKTKRRRKP